uniref:Sensory neuron membrane protein 2 n=1 Tax=Spodoptera litura TaxID=69820 RepID=A0A0K1DD11_SPOLT|nr:sensory neuron membrane protein 3 [Spodoptera litura]
MCGVIGSVSTLVIGAILVIGSCIVGFLVVPNIVRNVIISEVVLNEDTIQMDRFEEIPFSLNFTVMIFNITNPETVLNGGVPFVTEVGPYIYRLYQTREILGIDGDIIRYKRHEHFVFDPVLSHPRTEEDILTIINVPYHAIIQVAETLYPNLMPLVNLAINGVFGKNNQPFVNITARELLFDGITLCKDTSLIATIVCNIIRNIAQGARNIEQLEDDSLVFSILDYKEQLPSEEYEVLRGLNDPADLGRILKYGGYNRFRHWAKNPEGGVTPCNQINGTDAGIYPPFVNREESIFAINTDICRSVELRYEYDTEYKGIPTYRYAANEWLLDNDEGCFCLNQTRGLNREDGCLLKGAMELYSCVGAFLVMSYPHFLFADNLYRNSVVGMWPDEDRHKIFVDIEPNTGTPIRGAKRAQFNIFSRPVNGVPVTQPFRTALVPILWVDESIVLPDEFVEELTGRLLHSLRLVDIFIPVIIAACGLVLVVGAGLTIRAFYVRKSVKKTESVPGDKTQPALETKPEPETQPEPLSQPEPRTENEVAK